MPLYLRFGIGPFRCSTRLTRTQAQKRAAARARAQARADRQQRQQQQEQQEQQKRFRESQDGRTFIANARNVTRDADGTLRFRLEPGLDRSYLPNAEVAIPAGAGGWDRLREGSVVSLTFTPDRKGYEDVRILRAF